MVPPIKRAMARRRLRAALSASWPIFLKSPWVKIGFLAKFHAGLTYFYNFKMDFLKIVIFPSAVKPGCAFFFRFNRFS